MTATTVLVLTRPLCRVARIRNESRSLVCLYPPLPNPDPNQLRGYLSYIAMSSMDCRLTLFSLHNNDASPSTNTGIVEKCAVSAAFSTRLSPNPRAPPIAHEVRFLFYRGLPHNPLTPLPRSTHSVPTTFGEFGLLPWVVLLLVLTTAYWRATLCEPVAIPFAYVIRDH